MTILSYRSGEQVKEGDQITYHGEPAEVEFVVTERVGDPSKDWYLDEFPKGGFMIRATSFGHVFVTDSHTDEDLTLLKRKDTVPPFCSS